MSHHQTHILPKTFYQMTRLINYVIQQRQHFLREGTSLFRALLSIYGLGSPIDYQRCNFTSSGNIKDRDEVVAKLIEIQYDRNDIDFKRGRFNVRDVLEISQQFQKNMPSE